MWRKRAEGVPLGPSELLWLALVLGLSGSSFGTNLESITFSCDTQRNGEPPTSVHQLHPGDVQIIAALGDSVTAGNGIGASTVTEVLIQRRGKSWSIGGDSSFDDGVVTLANIIRKFNPDLVGASLDRGSWYSDNAKYNMAVPGSKAPDMVTQALRLIWQLGNDTSIDYDNDWKLVTLFVGGNDLCAFCTDRTTYSSSQYVSNLRDALDLLHEHVPRMLVSLVPPPDVSDIRFYSQSWLCDIVQWSLCSCAKNLGTVDELQALHWDYYTGARDLVASGRYDATDDFTVVLQPHLVRSQIPTLANGSFDLSYIAPDCFHPNEKMHELLAFSLWNVLITPVVDKPLVYSVGEERSLLCPTGSRSYIATNLNGDSSRYRSNVAKEENQYRTPYYTTHQEDSYSTPQEDMDWLTPQATTPGFLPFVTGDVGSDVGYQTGYETPEPTRTVPASDFQTIPAYRWLPWHKRKKRWLPQLLAATGRRMP